MNPLVVMLMVIVMFPGLLMMWNKQRTRGKVLGFFCNKDKSLASQLCELRDAFVIYGHSAYDIYPDLVRVYRFPQGWPTFFQETVPAILYDEDDAIPKDWITMEKPKDSAMKLRAALDPNWVRMFVQEASKVDSAGGFHFNLRKALPVILIGIGIIGLVVMLVLRSRTGG